MAKQIAKLLKADIQDTSDLKSIARMLAKKGRGGDTMLAHITPKEATILKEAGGAGSVNPDTGLLEFYDGFDFDTSSYGGSSYYYTPSASSFDTSTYYRSPSEDVIGNIAASAPEPSYTPAGSVAPLMQPGTVPNYQTYSYEQPAAAAAPVSVPQMTYGSWLSSPAGQEYRRQADLADIDIKTRQAGFAGPGIAPTPPSLAERALTKTGQFLEKLTPSDVLRIAGAGAGAVAGRAQAQQAAKQIEKGVQEQKDIGAPYQKTGRELQEAAMRGELTPQAAQAYQALQAQLAQGAAARGGVGAAQAAAQAEAFRQNLLQNQYNYGLQVAQIGDQYAMGAIKTGMQLDQQLQQATQQFYANLLAFAGGGAMKPATTTPGA